MRRTANAMGLSFPPFTRAVKQLLIANCAIFLLFALFRPSRHRLLRSVALQSPRARGHTRWFTARSGSWSPMPSCITACCTCCSICLRLWMFGAQLEMDWGYSLFMQFYFFCVIGAALCTVADLVHRNAGRLPAHADGGRLRRHLRPAAGLRDAARRFGSDALPPAIPDQSQVLRHRHHLPGALRSAVVGAQRWAVHRLHGPSWRRALRLHLPEVCAATGFGYATSERVYGLRNSYYRWKRKRAARKFEVYMRKHMTAATTSTKTTSTSTATSSVPSDPPSGQEERRLAPGWVN